MFRYASASTKVLVLASLVANAMTAAPAAGSPQEAIAFGTQEQSLLKKSARLDVRDVTLVDALTRLREPSQVDIVFSPTLLPSAQRVTCACADVTVGQALNRILEGTGFDYFEMPLQIVIRAPALPIAPSSRVVGPSSPFTLVNAVESVRWHRIRATRTIQPLRQGTITGRVVDAATQQPLSTVQVHIPALEIGTLTGPTGTFSLPNVPVGTHTVVAEVIGYRSESQVVTVVEDSTVTVNFSLAQTAVALEEVVAVGYGQQTRATVSGSVSTLNTQKLEGQAFTTMSDAIAGLVQGLNIKMMTSNSGAGPGMTAVAGTGNQIMGDAHDGRPGAPATLQIRNMGSPLVVIDGVPSDLNDFNNLNPADIEDISILKDASAAVYGFRAANGVVLVTTRRGNAMQAPRVRIDGYYGWQNLARHHFNPLANAYEYLFAVVDSQNNLNQARSIDPEELERYRIGAPGYETTDHYKLAINNPNAAQYNVNASISGGTSNAQYYLSVGHVQQDYVVKDFTWGRTNLAANLRTDLTDRFSIGTELRAQEQQRDEVAVLGNYSAMHIVLLSIYSSWPHETPFTGPNNNLMSYQVRYAARSVGMFAKEISGWTLDKRRQASANFWAEYRMPFGTTVRGTFAVRLNMRDHNLARRAFDYYCQNEEENTYYACHNSGDRSRQQLTERREGVFGNITLNHAMQAGAHSLSGAAFVELDGSENNMSFVIAQSPHNYTHLIDYTRLTNFGNTWDIERRASVGGRIDYDYDRKYLISALARYDGSFLYAPGRRWGFFPGISVGWRVTEEGFMQNRFGFLNDLKLRASWGQTGREQGVSPWGYLGGGTYGIGNGSVFDGTLVQGARPRGLPVTNLTWVTSTSRNLGVDALLLDGRLSIEADVFERELSGLPAARSDVLLPGELGYTLPNENLNSDVTRGFEMALTWTDQVGRVQYSISPNMTVARTMPTYRYMQRFQNSWHEYRNGDVGRWEGINFGYKVIGQFTSVDEIANYPVMIDGQGNRLLLPGDLIYEDVNGDRVINAMDMRPIGFCVTCTPIFSYGLGARVSFMGLSLTANFSGGALYDHERTGDGKNLSQGGHNMPKYAIDRWHRADPYNPQSEWIPGRYPPLRIAVSNPSYNRNDTFFRTNVRYIRLRRLEIGYEVPDFPSSRLGLSGLRIYTNLQNPFSWDNVQFYNLDPELTLPHTVAHPTLKLFNIGFSANVGGGPQTAVAGGD